MRFYRTISVPRMTFRESNSLPRQYPAAVISDRRIIIIYFVCCDIADRRTYGIIVLEILVFFFKCSVLNDFDGTIVR